MKNQLTSAALLLGLTLSSAFAMAAADAKTYVFECGASQKVGNPDGTAARIPLVAPKYLEMSDSGSIEIPFQVVDGNQTEDVILHADTMIQNIPDFPEPGKVYTSGSLFFNLKFKKDGRSFSTSDGAKNAIPLMSSGMEFKVGSNYYVASCSVTDKVNFVYPAPTQAKSK